MSSKIITHSIITAIVVGFLLSSLFALDLITSPVKGGGTLIDIYTNPTFWPFAAIVSALVFIPSFIIVWFMNKK